MKLSEAGTDVRNLHMNPVLIRCRLYIFIRPILTVGDVTDKQYSSDLILKGRGV